MSKYVERDERTTFIENKSYKMGYNFISFALLLDVIYRSLRGEASWDLLALIIFSGFIMSVYQYRQKILGKWWLKAFVATFIMAMVLAMVLVTVLK